MLKFMHPDVAGIWAKGGAFVYFGHMSSEFYNFSTGIVLAPTCM